MIIDVSDSTFKKIFQNKKFWLPIRWTGDDFLSCLERILNEYCTEIEHQSDLLNNENYSMLLHNVKSICGLLERSVKKYLEGFPAKAYFTFEQLMDILMEAPLRVYRKSIYDVLDGFEEKLNLFRVTSVKENVNYDRSRLFHTPYNLRSKVATCRYSIAGYPSLYLGTNLSLCCEEIHYNPYSDYALASKFQIERNLEYNNTEINVVELSLKPQDFLQIDRHNEIIGRTFNEINLHSKEIQNAYIMWFPIIASCSFIRTNKNDPFAVEYIVPQLLMQWVRSEMMKKQNSEYDQLIGIRYFSCASERASDLGFNYVFPVSGRQHSSKYPFCPILMKAFRMTKPYFINEYDNVNTCERSINKDRELKHVNEE